MNQLFSLNRFRLLVLMHWAENKKRYGLTVLAYMGLLVVHFLFSILVKDENDDSVDVQKTIFFFSLFLIGTLYASQYFRDLGAKAKASNFLLIPASTFEKFLCSLLYTIILFILVITASYYGVEYLLSLSPIQPSTAGQSFAKESLINVLRVDFFLLRNDLRISGLLFFIGVQSAFLFGSVCFKKYSFLKTVIIGLIIYFLVLGFFFYLDKPAPSDDTSMVRLPRWIEQIFGLLVMYVIAPVFWILTYYRLKHKQALA